MTKASEVFFLVHAMEQGLFFNLVAADYSNLRLDHLHWKTSYPFLDFFYPTWWPKKESYGKDDFWWSAIKNAEKEFSWNIISTNRIFKSFETFGEGVSQVQVIKNKQAKIAIPEIFDELVTVQQSDKIDIISAVYPYLSEFTEPLILIQFDFHKVRIDEWIPKTVGSIRKWNHVTVEASFETTEDLLERINSRRFLAFSTQDEAPEAILTNIMNYLYWKPATTSSAKMKDSIRSIYTDILAELGSVSEVKNHSSGHIFVTGEIPALFQDNELISLMIVDGLGISGMWSLYTDRYGVIMPLLNSNSFNDQKVSLSMVFPASDIWVIPGSNDRKIVHKVLVNNEEFLGQAGMIQKYAIQKHNTILEWQKNKSAILLLPKGIKCKSLIIDARLWPVEYGPRPTTNASRLNTWLEQLKK